MESKDKIEKPWWRDGLIIFAKVSGYIAVPIILASLIGKSLDKKYNSGSFIFFISIAVAFILTIFLIWRETKAYRKKMEKEDNLSTHVEEKNN